MLKQATLDTLSRLKLHGIGLAPAEQTTTNAAQGLAFEERLALLLEREEITRDSRRMTRLLQLATLKYHDPVIEDFEYRSRTGLDRSQLASLTSCEWIRSNQSVLIHGATGSGKTYLACALGHQACRQGLSVLYVRAPRLFEEAEQPVNFASIRNESRKIPGGARSPDTRSRRMDSNLNLSEQPAVPSEDEVVPSPQCAANGN